VTRARYVRRGGFNLAVLAELAAGASPIRAVRIAPAVPPGEHGRAGRQAGEGHEL
jgi:hypothetical protein